MLMLVGMTELPIFGVAGWAGHTDSALHYGPDRHASGHSLAAGLCSDG